MPDYQLTDEELISRFQNGDARAFDQIIYRFKDRLIIFVYRFLGNQERAEDIVQDTFMKVYTHKHSYREIAKFSTWLYTIAGNLARTELRKMKRRKTYSLSELSYDDKEYEIPVIKDPSNSLEKRNIGKNIQVALNELPPDFKTMIILRDIQELSYEDISRIVGVPIGTVKSRINRGRLKLKNLLKKIGGR